MSKLILDVIKIVGLLAFIIFCFVIGPVLVIWALNTIFPVLVIPYTLETWAAVVLIGIFIRGDELFKVKRKQNV
jgi:hypothetical protein